MIPVERKFSAYLDEMQSAAIIMPLSYEGGISTSFFIKNGELEEALEIKERIEIEQAIKYICAIPFQPLFGQTYWINDERGEQTDLQIGSVIRTPQFDEIFYYDGNDLGVKYEKEQSQFKLWAPTATQVILKLGKPDGTRSELAEMGREEKGVWYVKVPKDVECWSYSFLVRVNLIWREAVDPYAVTTTANGLLGVVVDLEKVKKTKPQLPPFEHAVDAIIYEAHIRDFSIHENSGISQKGKYLGLIEQDTVGTDGKPTGISYLSYLGITHLELLPFHDFAGVDELGNTLEYNWGYNPLHFNVPDGSYSSDPCDPYARIRELKAMITGIQKMGIRVIMDVVYNHVYTREESSFEKIVPGYFFRHDANGLPSNGTGVGNDIASERLMVRKFIVDSVRFWMTEYHVDGFRFDLMGILDIETMNEVKKVASAISSDILIIGEGWDLNTPLAYERKAIIRNQLKLPSIGQFNDWFRDSIKGSAFNLYDKGYAFGNEHYMEAAKQVLAGSVGLERRESGLFSQPNQTVNYVECHDNHTLWDKLLACLKDTSNQLRMDYHRLATSLVVIAQGIPFLHCGQEFFRTKDGVGNSYKSPDAINQVDWARKIEYEGNVEYIKGIIEVRKRFKCFRLRSADDIRLSTRILPAPSPMIVYTLDVGDMDPEGWSQLLVMVNPSQVNQNFMLPNGEWFKIVDKQAATPSQRGIVPIGQFNLEPVSLNILAKM